MKCIECGLEDTFYDENTDWECRNCGRVWNEKSKETKWVRLKTILDGALDAHALSGNKDRYSEVKWVLSQMEILEVK